MVLGQGETKSTLDACLTQVPDPANLECRISEKNTTFFTQSPKPRTKTAQKQPLSVPAPLAYSLLLPVCKKVF
jgi:hypothetical protein